MSLRNEIENFGDGIRLVSYCPVCDTQSNAMQAQTLGMERDTHLLHIQCRKCHNAFIALVLVNQTGASSIGLLTDLTYEDALKFQTNKNVNTDDVIQIHECLQNGMIPMNQIVKKNKFRTMIRVKHAKKKCVKHEKT